MEGSSQEFTPTAAAHVSQDGLGNTAAPELVAHMVPTTRDASTEVFQQALSVTASVPVSDNTQDLTANQFLSVHQALIINNVEMEELLLECLVTADVFALLITLVFIARSQISAQLALMGNCV